MTDDGIHGRMQLLENNKIVLNHAMLSNFFKLLQIIQEVLSCSNIITCNGEVSHWKFSSIFGKNRMNPEKTFFKEKPNNTRKQRIIDDLATVAGI